VGLVDRAVLEKRGVRSSQAVAQITPEKMLIVSQNLIAKLFGQQPVKA
jgi:hypothetical protein